ncbi:unnamed protein product, partial [Vitis vinifera]|uniref:Uncharacterized protein n=1 Tax=Vitis vinifera TaxID=29760 RepID=D7TSM4_VITVI
MPSKPLPWDWKDFFKERTHERSESLSLLQDRGLASGFLGVCSPGSADLHRPTEAREVGVFRFAVR